MGIGLFRQASWNSTKRWLVGGFGVGEESLDTQLFSEDEIPWDDLAFHSGRFALKKYFEDRGENNGVHFHELRRSKS